MNENYNELIEDLIAHPQIEERLRAILKIAKNSSGELIRADDAERQVIVEMRKMGTAVLQDWAHGQSEKLCQTALADRRLKKHKKKPFIGIQAAGQSA